MMFSPDPDLDEGASYHSPGAKFKSFLGLPCWPAVGSYDPLYAAWLPNSLGYGYWHALKLARAL
jgi:hypothetical protein